MRISSDIRDCNASTAFGCTNELQSYFWAFLRNRAAALDDTNKQYDKRQD